MALYTVLAPMGLGFKTHMEVLKKQQSHVGTLALTSFL